MARFRGRYRGDSARKPGWDYASPGHYLITMVTRGRRPMLGRAVGHDIGLTAAGSVVRRAILAVPRHFPHVTVRAWAIQPDHVHLLLHLRRTFLPPRSRAAAPESPYRAQWGGLRTGSVSKVIQAFKAAVTREARRGGDRGFAWQPLFHDRVISDPRGVAAAIAYVERHPPVRIPDGE